MTAPTVPPIALAVTHGHAIFLDCANDRYFALSPVENDALVALLAGEPVTERARRALTAATGVEATTQTLRSMLAVVAPAEISQSFAPERGLPWGVRLAAIWHLLVAKARLVGQGLHASVSELARVSTPPHAARAVSRREFEQIVGAHEWLSRHVAAHDACLLRSLALSRHLRFSGHAAELVIAVRPDPFSAHCWVQAENRLLNQDLDDIASFESILVVR